MLPKILAYTGINLGANPHGVHQEDDLEDLGLSPPRTPETDSTGDDRKRPELQKKKKKRKQRDKREKDDTLNS